jgi:hypothetical protein
MANHALNPIETKNQSIACFAEGGGAFMPMNPIETKNQAIACFAEGAGAFMPLKSYQPERRL